MIMFDSVKTSFESTYEELKPGVVQGLLNGGFSCFESTYEELKLGLQIKIAKIVHKVLSLPMRN